MPHNLRLPLLLALFLFMAFAVFVGGFPDKSAADCEADDGKRVQAIAKTPAESKQGGVSVKRVLTAAGLAVGLLLSGGAAGGIGGNIVSQQKPTAEVGAVQQRHQQGQTLPWMGDTWQPNRKLLDAMEDDKVSPPNLAIDEIHEIVDDDADKTLGEMKIRHGHPIPDIRQLPFMATTWNNGTRWCACTVLSPWYVLMAAHCFFYRNSTDPPLVVLAGTRKAKLEPDNGVQRKYDSGGPLLIRNQADGGWEQIGIIHGGNPECKLTAVQTAVSFYCNWIAKITKLGGKEEVKCAD